MDAKVSNKRESMKANIDPEKLYPLAEAAGLVPSSHAGKQTHPETLKRYVRMGILRATFRKVVKKRLWFFQGSELIRFLGADQPPTVEAIPEQAPDDRRQRRAEELSRKLGMKV